MRRACGVVLAWGVLSPSAQAQCTTLTYGEFIDSVGRSLAAIDNDDVDLHAEITAELSLRVPCLEQAVPREEWAAFLVGLSVVEYALGKEWEQPLSTALLVDPYVERDYGPSAIQQYPTLPEPASGRPLQPDATYYLDGQPLTATRSLAGLHILQRQQEDRWESFWLEDGVVPEAWVVPEDVGPPSGYGVSTVWGNLAAIGGFGTAHQDVLQPTTHFPESSVGGMVAGLASYGMVSFGPIGAFWDITMPIQTNGSASTELYAGLSLPLGPVTVWAGGGGLSVSLEEATEHRFVLLPQPHLGAELVVGLSDGLWFDAGLGGGWTPAATHFVARGALAFSTRGPFGWYVGTQLTSVSTAFVEEGGSNEVGVGRWRAVLRIGLTFDS